MLMCRGKEPALAGRYMRWELLIFLTERGLTAMRNRNMLFRAEQSSHSRCAFGLRSWANLGWALLPKSEIWTALQAEHGLTAPFLRLAVAGRLKLNTTFVMDNRRILTGLLYPVRFGGFYHIRNQYKEEFI